MTRIPYCRFIPSALLAAMLLVACGGGTHDSDMPPIETPPACVALPSEVVWHRDSLSSEWNDVLIDSRNRIWLAGWSNGIVGQSNIEPAGDSRAVLRELAPDGGLLWDAGNQFDSSGSDSAEALVVSAQGTIFMAGRTTGSFAGTPNAGQFDTFVAWTDAPGSTLPWHLFQTGSERPQHPRKLELGVDGDLLLAGQDDDYVPSNYVEAWSDAFVMRMRRQDTGSAAQGIAVRWTHQMNSLAPDISGGLAVDAGGATYISGTMQGGATPGMYVRKIDASGAAVWTARYSALAADHIAVVRAAANGELLIGGTIYGAFRDGTPAGGSDVFVARVSADDGRVVQSWQFGSPAAEWLADLQLDRSGNVIIFGETTGSISPATPSAGGNDLFMTKLAPDGRTLATRQWGTPGDEHASRLAVDSCGAAVAVGSSGTLDASGRVVRRDAITWFWQP